MNNEQLKVLDESLMKSGIEEILLICIEYLKVIYDIDQEEIESWINKKIKRLKERMG